MAADEQDQLRPIRHLVWMLKEQLDWVPSRLRRQAFILCARAHAVWQRADIRIEVAKDVRFGKAVRASLTPRTRNVLTIGPRCSLGERTLFVMKGGEIVLGDWVDIRRDSILTVAGRLYMEGQNVLQPGIGIHCDEAVTLRRMASIGERTTIIDCVHYFSTPDEFFADNVKTGSIELGYNSWIGAQVTVGRNVTVGDFAVVAANALVLDDVPSGHLASGVPATIVRPVRLPWRDGATAEVSKPAVD
jgi:acetyltransferase-like isoleucine patch superfamily enzyme